MDATEVIELLDDSSDAASEPATAQTSACTTPAASPAVPPMRAPSDGYADVVQRALAVAAALETEKASAGKRQRGRPKVPPAPPLLSTKTKKPHVQPAAERRPAAPKPAVKPRSSWNTVTHRPARSRARSSSFSSSLSSSSDSDSSRSSGTHSRRRVGAQQVPRRPNGAVQPTPRRPSSAAQPSSATPFKTKRPLERRLKNNGVASRKRLKERRRGVAGVQAPAKNQQPAEVVDLLSSSSSSSDSSTGRRSRLSSQSSLSSDSDSPSLVPARSARKRLMQNDRVKGRSVSYPTPSSGPQARNTVAVSRPQFASVATNTTVVKPRGGSKRNRVLPNMRRETTGNKRGRAPRGRLVKETMKRKESTASGVRFGAPTLKAAAATHTSPLSLSSSSLSSSSSSAPSSPASSPRPVPSRKSVTTPLAAADRYTREGDTDALGRYHCRKSASASSVPPRKVTSHSPPPARRASVSAVASPSPSPSTSPSPRKKRRVASHLYFDTDRVALDDLQAQERELARIRSQRKQTQARLRPSKPSGSKKKTPPEVICVDDHSDANSTAYSEEAMQDDGHHNQTEVKASATAEPAAADVSSRSLFHPTSYRGVYFSEAPLNILSLQGQACSAPYESRCDHPLTFYDETDTLASQCAILESFGKPTQCISSVFPSEAPKPQTDIAHSVRALVTAYLPNIRSCHRKKVDAILAEARQKIAAYQMALKKHKRAARGQNVTPYLLSRSTAEKHRAMQLKSVRHTCSLSAGGVSFQIGRGDGVTRERHVSSLIQVNHIEVIQPLRKYTTSIGVRANYRVEDDPILRYTASTRPSSAGAGGEVAKKYALRIGNVADEEVVEYMLRLVVARLGDSEQVFQALKTELNFSQAYTAYSELKKLHDSRQRASARLDRAEALSRDGAHAADAEITAIVNLMEQSCLSRSSRAKALSRRLQPPIFNLESSTLDSLVDSATLEMAALGLRSTDSYGELVDVYCGSFCRMCYMYACHEHGGDHPLPARRVDPVYPRIRSAPPTTQPIDGENAACSMEVSDANVVYVGSGENGEAGLDTAASTKSSAQNASGWGSDVDMSDASEQQLQEKKKTAVADPSEYIDASHISLTASKMSSFLSKHGVCSKQCWKNGDSAAESVSDNRRSELSTAEVGVIRKLRETMGDNSCLLAAIVDSASCIELHEFIKQEQASDPRPMSDSGGRSSRRMRNWAPGRRSGGSNRELLQRTRNQRLQDRGTENHEYKPCMHEGMCDSMGCSCMKRDHMCEKACACSRDCPNRFEGCSCSPGDCRTSKCPCFAALRECDPDVCLSCGASELAVATVAHTVLHSARVRSTCGNVNVIRSKHKRLGMGFSSIHGYGMYAREAIACNEFVYEYTGAMLSQDEAERRGLIYDKMEMSYLFDLNEDAVLDALRSGNKSKFINHDGETPNCTAKVVSVCGVHHISIWALRDIAVGEELVFDYGYKRSVGPDWSQH